MTNEAKRVSLPERQESKAAVATVLSMKLEHHTKDAVTKGYSRRPANVTDDVEDLWDNVPI